MLDRTLINFAYRQNKWTAQSMTNPAQLRTGSNRQRKMIAILTKTHLCNRYNASLPVVGGATVRIS